MTDDTGEAAPAATHELIRRLDLPRRQEGDVFLCGACRELGHCRIGMHNERIIAPGVTSTRFICRKDQEGGRRVAHGGWTAMAFDEALGHLVLLHGGMSVTAQLTVEFLRPVPIEREVEIIARLDGGDAKRLQISGEMTLAATGAVLARAHGLFAQRADPVGHFDKLDAWLDEQDRIAAEKSAED